MKKNHIIAAALAILLAGCSAENTASTSENVTDTSTESVISSAESQTSDADEKVPEQNSNGELVKVSSFDGKTLTGTKLDMPAMGGSGQGAPQGTPPDMNGDMPQKPDDNGNGGNTPPERPEGDGNGDNTPPERPDNSDGNAPDGNPPKMSGEEVTYNVSDSADISIEISEGDMVRIVTDENGEIISIEKEEFGSGMPMGQNSFGANGTDNGTSANSIEDNAALSDTAFTSSGDDENALRADNVTAALNNVNITKTGSSSNTENGDFYGMNAAFLAENGADVKMSLASQSVSGDIVVDDISTLDLTLSSSDITGAINSDNSGGSIVLILDGSSSITLTGDSYVSGFNGDISQINAGNFHFYVNGEKLL